MTGSGEADFPQYSEVWIVDLDPVRGAELGKRRPALIVSRDENNQYAATVTVLPITSAPARRDYPDEVVIPSGVGGLSKVSRVKANMIRTVSKGRLSHRVGRLPTEYRVRVERAIRTHLKLR